MKKLKLDQCVNYAREWNEEKKMDEEQIVLLWNMLSDETENISLFEFVCKKINKVVLTDG